MGYEIPQKIHSQFFGGSGGGGGGGGTGYNGSGAIINCGWNLILQFTMGFILLNEVYSEVCETKILDDIPPDPYYDASDITIGAAHDLATYLSIKSSSTTPTEINKKAQSIALDALQQDDGLLALAIAAPSIKLAVVQFRDHVLFTPEGSNHSFLSIYWRELGEAWNHSDGAQFWGAPFRDCGPMHGRWLWPFSVTVEAFGYKIVSSSFIAADEDHCNQALAPIFGKNHSCDPVTTFCFQSMSNESMLTNTDTYSSSSTAAAPKASYICLCHQGYYVPNESLQGFYSEKVESGNGNYSCLRCPGGCLNCDKYGTCNLDDSQESVSMETLLRAIIGIVLGSCVLCCFVLAAIVFKERKCKTIAFGMWTVLETILLGILLLYAAVVLHFLPASTCRCILEPWCRELGFMICYGAIILKLYRHLVEFRTRKAHRWVLRDVDLLKYLGAMVFGVICYLSAYTASSIDLIHNANFIGLKEENTNTCRPLKWEYVTQISEILILIFGLHLAVASRNANTQFRERQFLVASLLIEFFVSANFYILRILYLPELSPGAIFLALFVRSLLTNTVTVGLIFLPKLWYQHKQVRSLAYDLSCRLPVDAFKGSHETSHHGAGYAGICLGDPDIGELTISEMSPEDIRAELKRLYTQLEVLKNKTIVHDNPHISKRRGGRKAHRRFSLQKKGSKEKAQSSKHKNHRHNVHHDLEITEAEASRTPEDSVCSIEGPTDTYAELSEKTKQNPAIDAINANNNVSICDGGI